MENLYDVTIQFEDGSVLIKDNLSLVELKENLCAKKIKFDAHISVHKNGQLCKGYHCSTF